LISARHTELILNSLPGIYYLLDQTGKFLEWNRNLEVISGYTADEIANLYALDMFGEDEKSIIAERIEKVFAMGKADVEGNLVSKNGDKHPHYFTGTLIMVDGHPCLIGMGIDISRRRRAESILKETQERYQLIVETAQEGIWLIDENNLTTFVNEPMAHMLGYEREEMLGRSLYHFLSKEYFTFADNHIARRRNGISDNEELILQRKNGQPICAHMHASPIFKDQVYKGSLAMVTDITGKKAAEQQLRLSEQRFKSLVQNSSDLISIIDEQGITKYVSPIVKDILGYDATFVLGKSSFDFIHEEDRPSVNEELVAFLQGQSLVTSPYRFLHQDGTWRWLESRGTNLLNDPDIKGLIISSRDITERIELQEELDRKSMELQKEMTAAVIKAQENERSQLGQELHDNVNQVLTTVKLYNEMVIDGLGDPKELIGKSIYLLQNCINEIRSISKRLSAPTLGHITLQDSIKELVESINLIKRVNIIYTIDGFINTIESQELHLAIYRIVQEQLNNILKYAEANFASIEIALKDNTLLLTIIDDGKGFDMRQKNEGIGIANMRSRAENLNGSFLIQSAPGQGCLVKVRIPLPAKD
jgi:PAS domain S-box-containing protein